MDFYARGRFFYQVRIKGDAIFFEEQYNGRTTELEKPLFLTAFHWSFRIGLHYAGDVECSDFDQYNAPEVGAVEQGNAAFIEAKYVWFFF